MAIAAGDREALARLYDRYAPTLLAIGLRILRDRREAEDLLHDVLLEAWRQAASYDPNRGSVRTWLAMRVRSRALDRRRAAGFSRSVPFEEAPAAEGREAGGEDLTLAPDRATVRRVLAELPNEQRAVLELGYFEGLSSSEISARIEAPVGTVKSRVAAALAKLRAAFGVTREVTE